MGSRDRGDLRPRGRERGSARNRCRGCGRRFEHAIRQPQADQGAEPLQERSRGHRHRDQGRHHRPDVGSVRATSTRILDGIKARVAKANAEGELGEAQDHAGERRRRRRRRPQRHRRAAAGRAGQGLRASCPRAPPATPAVSTCTTRRSRSSGGSSACRCTARTRTTSGCRTPTPRTSRHEFTSRNADVIKALGGKKIAIIGNNTGERAVFTEQ